MLHYTKLWDKYSYQKWGKQVENERTTHVLAWMPQYKNTWSRNSRNRHSAVFLLPSGTRLIQLLRHKTSHYITSHSYAYTHALCLIFLTGLGYSLLYPPDEVPRIQWIGCRKFFPEVIFKYLPNLRICIFFHFHQIINFYFLPSKIRFDSIYFH